MTAKDIIEEYASTYMAYRQFLAKGMVADQEYTVKSTQLGIDTLMKLMEAGYDQDIAMKMIMRAQDEAPEIDNQYQSTYIN